jgi:hypothetical protein
MTSGDITSIASTFPADNTFATNATEAARETAVGVLPTGFLRYISPFLATRGADVNAILNAQGVVRNPRLFSTTSTITVRYQAPDVVACFVDRSLDGIAWTRAQAAGGTTNQLVTFTGLASQTAYQLRLICASQTQTFRMRTL